MFAKPLLPASKLSSSTTIPQTPEEVSPPPAPVLNYTQPEWSGLSNDTFVFEVLKSGAIVETISVTKPTLLVGRLPTCDISLEHASVSRHHAIIQASASAPDKLFIFDLNSAHGTFINKVAIKAREYVSVRNGDLIKFGQSTRVFVVVGGGDNVIEDNYEKEHVNSTKLGVKNQTIKEEEEEFEVTWGFGEDATNDDELMDESIDSANHTFLDHDAYYHRDSKKALKTWCDSKNVEMAFTFEEEGHGITKLYVASISLDVNGSFTLTATGKGSRKKEAERQAALDACLKLDRRNLLRSTGSSNKSEQYSKRKSGNNDDDGEDSFFDRTERIKKPKKSEINNARAETYESLLKKLEEKKQELFLIDFEIEAIEAKGSDSNKFNVVDDDDEIDQFISGLENSANAKQKKTLTDKRRILTKEHERISKLVQITKPHEINLPITVKVSPETTSQNAKAQLEALPNPSSGKLIIPTVSELMPPPPPLSRNGPAMKVSNPETFLEIFTSLDPIDNSTKDKFKQKLSANIDGAEEDGSTQKGESNSQFKAAISDSGRKPSRRRAFTVMTKEQVNEHESVQEEEMVDAVHVGNDQVNTTEVSKYGY
ncbi:Kanadaptin [Physocladia obscura]|uniref:Kanadaptin n=1 Tax=Physocladia obscura TaxID=109957 RepID=A0AAD5SZ39_9FUNG|nr:Kanadaptin [Physocladia obscura]